MQLYRGTADTSQAKRFAYYDAIASNPHIEGVVVPFRWRQLEGANRGDYDAGVRLIRSEIAKLKSLSSPKRLFIRMNDVAYGYSADTTFPDYLLKTSGATFAIGAGTQWRRWNSKYMGWYIDMLKNLCKEFDSEPWFEGLYLTRETAQSWSGAQPVADYDNSAFVTQLKRLGAEVKLACPSTNVVMPLNYIGGQSQANDMIAHQKLHGLGQGGPDVIVPGEGRQYPHGYHALLGTSPAGGHDYRGEIPVIYSTESTNVNGRLADASLQEIWDFATKTLRVSHLFWDRYENDTATSVNWNARVKFIAAHPTFPYTECPEVYGSCAPSP